MMESSSETSVNDLESRVENKKLIETGESNTNKDENQSFYTITKITYFVIVSALILVTIVLILVF